jgi:hypothetical protein
VNIDNNIEKQKICQNQWSSPTCKSLCFYVLLFISAQLLPESQRSLHKVLKSISPSGEDSTGNDIWWGSVAKIVASSLGIKDSSFTLVTDMFKVMREKGMIKCESVKRHTKEPIDLYLSAFCPAGIVNLHVNMTGLSSRLDTICLEECRGFDARELIMDQHENSMSMLC